MPALKNVKWERFCQAIVNGVAKQGQKFSQGKAYISAGYNAKGSVNPEDQPKSAPPNCSIGLKSKTVSPSSSTKLKTRSQQSAHTTSKLSRNVWHSRHE